VGAIDPMYPHGSGPIPRGTNLENGWAILLYAIDEPRLRDLGTQMLSCVSLDEN
jgi:hypothetical protein